MLVRRAQTQGGRREAGVSHEHLDYYLDEFTFRFNRRTSRHRGKLFYRLVQQAAGVDPAPYPSLIKRVRPGIAPYWVAAGGGVEEGDKSPEGALFRELSEELAAQVRIVRPVFRYESKS